MVSKYRRLLNCDDEDPIHSSAGNEESFGAGADADFAESKSGRGGKTKAPAVGRFTKTSAVADTLKSSNTHKGRAEDEEEIEDEYEIEDAAEDNEVEVEGGEDEEEEDEEEEDEEGEEGGKCVSPRLYSCDACPHAIFTTHAALLMHAEERHADLLPDHARLRRIAEKLSPVWSRALKARRESIRLWGKKVFDIAARRDAGEAKMREAHRARAQLEIVVRRWHEKARVFIFGSSVAMGVWDGIADIDFAVVDVAAMETGSWPPMEKNAVRSITELLRRAGFSFVNLEPITHARVPIIKHHASSPICIAARREAEDVVARSVRFALSDPASREDRVMLEGSVRDAVGPGAVQQLWWNRTGDHMCVTLDTTVAAVQAAMCAPALATPTLRVKAQPLHDECRPELYNVDFDLSFRAFGIRNSHLLRQYLHSHPCARPGSIVLKDWSKTSGVNNSVNGYFTSYAINIMWIYYLIQKKHVPYVDPLDIPESLVNCTNFDPVYTPIVDPSLAPAELDALFQQAGDMLVGFFYFYSFEFDWAQHVISLNRPGITTKRMLGWHVEDVVPPMSSPTNPHGVARRHTTRYELCIEDPYEENLNLGRHVGITKALRVRTELYRGLLSLLKDGERESCVFASTDREGAAEGGGTTMQLPARALARLMALATREVAAASRPSIEDPSNPMNINSSSNGKGKEKEKEKDSLRGVPEQRLERVFAEEAALEFDLARRAWNWHQLIHRLGYKIHRGYVLPRRELGVRRAPRRDDETEQQESHSELRQEQRQLQRQEQQEEEGGLTENMTRDISRGFMTLTPEWVAWSTPWANRHLRGYSRLVTAAATHIVSPTATGTAATAPSSPNTSALGPSGAAAMGALRGTRRNAAPLGAADLARRVWRTAVSFRFTR